MILHAEKNVGGISGYFRSFLGKCAGGDAEGEDLARECGGARRGDDRRYAIVDRASGGKRVPAVERRAVRGARDRAEEPRRGGGGGRAVADAPKESERGDLGCRRELRGGVAHGSGRGSQPHVKVEDRERALASF